MQIAFKQFEENIRRERGENFFSLLMLLSSVCLEHACTSESEGEKGQQRRGGKLQQQFQTRLQYSLISPKGGTNSCQIVLEGEGGGE